MTVKVSPKYQVVIPGPIRKALGLKAGSMVEVLVKGNVAYLVPLQSLTDIQKNIQGKLDKGGLRDKKDRIA